MKELRRDNLCLAFDLHRLGYQLFAKGIKFIGLRGQLVRVGVLSGCDQLLKVGIILLPRGGVVLLFSHIVLSFSEIETNLCLFQKSLRGFF